MKTRISIAVVVFLVAAAAVFMRYGSTAESPAAPGVLPAAVPAAAASSAPATPEVPPHLTMASMEHSFGTVKQGTPLRYSFVLNNEGPGVLEIKQVNPSCGCTTSSFDKTIAPKQSGSINLAIEKTETYMGEIAKTAQVLTNDPKNANFTLTLRANFVK